MSHPQPSSLDFNMTTASVLVILPLLFSSLKWNQATDTRHKASAISVAKNESSLLACSTPGTLCPPWQNCIDGSCTCGETPHNVLYCDKDGTLDILNCFCTTYDWNTSTMELGQCILNCQHKRCASEKRIYRSLTSNLSDLDEVICGKFNRRGSLCGSCKDGYFPLAYSYNMTCVKCEETWYNWIEYLLIVYVPITIFYLVILFFQVNVTSSSLLGFLLFSQAISFPMMCRIMELSYHHNVYYQKAVEIAFSLYGFWNLDFFRILNHSTCLQSSFLFVAALDIISGIYPLVLVYITYLGKQLYDADFKLLKLAMKPLVILLRKFGENFKIKTSLIDAFSTFFLLSNIKLFNASYDILAATKVYLLDSSGNLTSTYRLFLDGDMTYFGRRHLPYGILATSILIVFHLMPTLGLILYPFGCIQSCLTALPQRTRIFIKTFMDPFQGSLTDGTERGTINCRWFLGVLFAMKFILLLVYAICFDTMYFVLGTMVLVPTSMAIVILQPFNKHTKHNVLTPSFLLYLCCAYISLIAGDIATTKEPSFVPLFQALGIILGLVPLIYVTFLATCWKCRTKATRNKNRRQQAKNKKGKK